MTIKDKTGQTASITEVWRALRFFTNRRKLIRLFVSYLNEDTPRAKILFFHGDGGNGKSLLLRYLREYYCKRFKREYWEWLKDISDNEEFAELAKNAVENVELVPYAALDFGFKTGDDQPQEAFYGLLMLRRQLAASKIRFPLFDFACVWYLKKTNQLNESRLRSLFPAEEMDFIAEMVNAASGTSFGAIAKTVLGIIGKHFKEKYTLYRQKRGLDAKQIEQIDQMDAERELIEYLPDFFAQDLNAAMEQETAPPRIILFFDTHESFWGHQRDMPEATYFRHDEWLRRLLCELELSRGIVAIVAGREHPRWAKATRSIIPEDFIDAHLVGHLPPADADKFLRDAGIGDENLRQSLTKYAEVETDEVHPLYLGLCADIVLAAKLQNKELTADNFHSQPQRGLKEKELVDRLLSYVDADTRNAVCALAACRAFNKELFVKLGNALNFHATDAAFQTLLSFSFVWRAERRGEGWYRIHELLRRLFDEQDKPKLEAAHKVLEQHYREKSKIDVSAIAEALYHANRQDRKRGIAEWREIFEANLAASRHQICRSLQEVRREMLVDDGFDLPEVLRLEGAFYFNLSLYAEAKQEYTESIAAYERVWKLMPDYFSVHDQQGVVLFWTIPLPWSDYHSIYNNKGLVWHQIGNLHAMLGQFDEARENYQKAIESIDQALQIIPVYITHDIEKPAVRNPDNLPNGLSQFNEARESHKKTIESVAIDDFNKGIQLLSNKSVIAHNNKGSVLDSLGDLQCDLSLFDEAQESYQAAIESFDESLEYAHDMVKYNPFFMLEAMKSYDEALNKYVPRAFIAHNNKGITLGFLGSLQKRSNQFAKAEKSYRTAIESFDRVLKLAPDFIDPHHNKGGILRSLGELYVELSKFDKAQESYQAAIECYDEALKLAPDYIYAQNNKAIALRSFAFFEINANRKTEGCEKLNKALAEFSRSLEFAPNDANIQNLKQDTQDLIDELCREKEMHKTK